MIKQISTYGAALLTLMVIVRATTMETNLDLSSLYQRDTDVTFESNNNELRANYIDLNNEPHLLLADLRIITTERPLLRKKYIQPNYNESTSISENEDLAFETIVEEVIDEQVEVEGLSLDRESTVNSNLSLFLPRQRIQPKPTQGSNQQ